MASQVIHDGIIDDDRVYTIHAMARIFGVKEQAMRDWLRELECPIIKPGIREMVTGHDFRMAVQRYGSR